MPMTLFGTDAVQMKKERKSVARGPTDPGDCICVMQVSGMCGLGPAHSLPLSRSLSLSPGLLGDRVAGTGSWCPVPVRPLP